MIIDQAERLRRLIKRKELGVDVDFSTFMENASTRKKRLIAFMGDPEEALSTSMFVANCAVSMGRLGKRILVLDASSSRVDASIPLGVTVKSTMETVMDGLCKVPEALYTASERVQFVKMGTVLQRLPEMDFKGKKDFFDNWMSLEESGELLLLHEAVPSFCVSLKEVVLVFSPSKAMVASAYARLKQYLPMMKGITVQFVVNMAQSEKEASATADKFMSTVKRFLSGDLEYLGCVPYSSEAVKAVKARVPFVTKFPYCASSSAVNLIANKLIHGLPLTEKGLAYV